MVKQKSTSDQPARNHTEKKTSNYYMHKQKYKPQNWQGRSPSSDEVVSK